MPACVGVDWAGHGWVAAHASTGNQPTIEFHPTIFDLWESYPPDTRLVIDIPIGLCQDGRRRCDLEVKSVLGSRGNSLFYTPTRQAAYQPNLVDAKAAQQHLDFSIQNQAWSLVPRIREVDQFLQRAGKRLEDGHIIETHPEIAFASLNDGRPCLQSKKSPAGEEERLSLIDGKLGAVRDVFADTVSRFNGPAYATRFVKPDDVLDAMVSLVVALHGGDNPPTFPLEADPDRDEVLGRDCEIAYASTTEWPH